MAWNLDLLAIVSGDPGCEGEVASGEWRVARATRVFALGLRSFFVVRLFPSAATPRLQACNTPTRCSITIVSQVRPHSLPRSRGIAGIRSCRVWLDLRRCWTERKPRPAAAATSIRTAPQKEISE